MTNEVAFGGEMAQKKLFLRMCWFIRGPVYTVLAMVFSGGPYFLFFLFSTTIPGYLLISVGNGRLC